MRFIISIPLALILAAAAQDSLDYDGILRCSTETSTLAINSSSLMEKRQNQALQPISIDLYLHFVAPDDGAPKKLLRKAAKRQLYVLNNAFRPSGISFTMRHVLFWNDAFHATIQNHQDLASMIARYHRGDANTLNLFVPKFPSQSLGIGACISFDNLFIDQTVPLSSDGCFVSPTTFPGTATAGYNQGKTAVHEAGHWLGLLHTFEGGCDGQGDHIFDTPAQAKATYTCDEWQDTCPFSPGLDPIHNYMGYSYE
ncbi:uncharacterized protein G6M90_00g094450 [Metarhizium brunneum]|uniref:Peptidase M43 pregnancy-associated plasma-A domain-containing protein n=1 Tax=Metarhizium brunneum TaxID=500148 RepID=A0A7D5YY86_9HYPO